jgi:CRISPR-associated protein Csm3
MDAQNPLYGKVFINGEIECLTGLHIGVSQQVVGGPVDSPVVRDPITNVPYIPGSSLRGRLRALFERKLHGQYPSCYPYRDMGQDVHLHVCNETNCPICRLFGSVAPIGVEEHWTRPSPLKIRDLTLVNKADLKNLRSPLPYTEWKIENALDRITAHSNPRDIERVPKGARFSLSIIYDVTNSNNQIIQNDLMNLATALSLLEDDALGGHSVRGYGRVKVNLCKLICKNARFYEKPEEEAVKDEALYHEESVSDVNQLKRLIPEIRCFFHGALL